jgi:D-psicose/D-tagatose/L-ribulose 3-epimerase
MQLGLINSAWLGSPLGTLEGIRKTKEIGFDSIDIFADPLEINIRERRLIKDTCRGQNLPVVSVACVAAGLADFNASVRRFHIDRAKKYLELVYELEARNLLLVLGEYIWQQEVIAPRDQWNWAVQSVRELGEFAASLGVAVALELEPFKLSLINNVARMRQFLGDTNHPAVRANIDISHMLLSGSGPEDVAMLAGCIEHVHLSDCDGKKHGDLPPGRGVVRFEPYLEAIAATGFTGTVSIELEYSPDPAGIVDWVKEAYRQTDKIMQSLRLRNARAATT